ncbi:hypothetical protein D5086_004762 [Populus alba]|uniref:Uncharacterized protein n=1 Tax=Populus alba TaxID=43335 RepID=A0ACC4CSF3_POPAL
MIRRYVYNDVLRLDDAQKLFDSAFVQSYTTNSAKVIFLNQRPLTRPVNIRGNICSRCDRGLQFPHLFCSISCKVDHILRTKGVSGLSSFLYDCKFLPLSEPGSDEGLMTPVSVLEPAASSKTNSSSGGDGGVACRALACTATTEILSNSNVLLFQGAIISFDFITCRKMISMGLSLKRTHPDVECPFYVPLIFNRAP